MKIIVGLGNIGEKYTMTRHNIGFITVNQFIHELKADEEQNSKLKAICSKTDYEGHDIFLAKPTTLMNRSGQSVSAILSYFKAKPEDLIVIYDDVDLDIGKIRIRHEGSAGTHNGMKSIIQELGTQEFTRIRIGIESRGKFAPAQQDLSSFVLSRFTEDEIEELKPVVAEALTELKKLITEK